MKTIIPINLAVEDPLSEAVIRKIIENSGREFFIGVCYSRGGFGYLKRTIRGFNNAAKSIPFVVLTDLDNDTCPATKIQNWLPEPKHPNLLFRIAVHEVESWLLADQSGLARFLAISKELITTQVDEIQNPKEYLIEIAKKSKKRDLREAIVPNPASTARVGPDYNGCLINFIHQYWNIEKARNNSPSLNRTIITIQNFEPSWI